MKLYIYADLINQTIRHTDHNFWHNSGTFENPEIGAIHKSDYSTYQLLEIRDVWWNGEFDFVSGKIKALELKLGDLHIQTENIKEQIQELLCIGHDNSVESPAHGDIPPDLPDPIQFPEPDQTYYGDN